MKRCYLQLVQKMTENLGFMQGRLVNMIKKRIQAFPILEWEKEFQIAKQYNFTKMEWTIDDDGFYGNPIINSSGKNKVKKLKNKFGLNIPSITCDCIMQNPFWKSKSEENYEELLSKFKKIISSSREIGIDLIVVPLVDNGNIENVSQEKKFENGLKTLLPIIKSTRIMVAFETDLNPQENLIFIKEFDRKYFGINYDMGNSACEGYDPTEEIESYGSRIVNVHVKDRPLGGSTVPLSEGSLQLKKVLSELKKSKYSGNYILQTARAKNNDHVVELIKNRKFFLECYNEL